MAAADKGLNKQLIADLVNAKVGLEVETHRINHDGQISQFDYPHDLLDQKRHHFIKNDFLQTQSELITPPALSTQKGLQYLGVYHQALRGALASGELLWPYSMPPHMKADHSDIKIAEVDSDSYVYRQRVAKIRDIQRTSETGVHVNIGLTGDVINTLQSLNPSASIDNIYLQAAVGFMQYRWLLTYLFGATPYAFKNYFSEKTHEPDHPVRSIRNSNLGYGNGFLSSYQSVAEYVKQIHVAVNKHQIIAEREYYGTVRLKQSDKVSDLLSKGIAYIELRIYDLDPFEPTFVSADSIDLIRLMFAYFISRNSFNLRFADQEIAVAVKKNNQVALENPLDATRYQTEATAFIERLIKFSQHITLPFDAEHLCFKMIERIENPLITPSARLVEWAKSSRSDLFNLLLKFAKGYQNDLVNRPTIGFESQTRESQTEILHLLQKGKSILIK